MIKETFIILLLLISQLGVAQFQDDFSDGDFTNNPEWIGDTDNFSIDNGMLRLTAPAVSDASYLATESQSIEDAVWEFYVEMDFQPSGSNLTRV